MSWKTYFEIVAVALVIYYALILLVFNRNDIIKLLSLRFQTAPFQKNVIEDALHKGTSETSNVLAALPTEIKYVIQQANNNKSPKEEMLFALQKLFSDDSIQAIHDPFFKKQISEFILKECESICSIHLSEEDLRVLWI